MGIHYGNVRNGLEIAKILNNESLDENGEDEMGKNSGARRTPIKKNKEPGLLRKAHNFSIAAVKHFLKKAPSVPQEEIDRRYQICSNCEYLKTKNDIEYCSHYDCGCNVSSSQSKYLSKLAWADQKCPLEPPKWDVYEIDVNSETQ